MERKELKDLVKGYFNLEDKKDIKTQDNVEAVKLQSAKLVDGTPITNDKDSDFEVGDTVYVTTEAGDKVLAPSGEHVLDDGIVLVIDGEGSITGLNKPDESGQGSLSEDKLTEETLADVKEEAEVKLADNAISESDALPMNEHYEDEESMEEHGIKEEIIEAIMGEIAPMMDEMKKKLAEHDEQMKEHMSSAADKSITEKAFAKATFGATGTGDYFKAEPMDLKKLQYQEILSRGAKN
tara:strand:+ start:1374 stop:2087 length:714 start_codon:yes stop_codon:yes gene_type:complete